MNIAIKDRTLVLSDRTLVPAGDNLTKTVTFTLPRFYGGLDLSQYGPSLRLEPPEGEPYSRTLDLSVKEDMLELVWTVARRDTQVHGRLALQVCFQKTQDEDVLVWQSHRDYLEVTASVEAGAEGEDIPPTVFEQAEAACLEAVAAAQQIKDSIVPPEIGEDGNWVVNGVSTGKPSRGEKGGKVLGHG